MRSEPVASHPTSGLTAATFLRLAELLQAQPADAWSWPSLCEEWQVRHVIAHMTTAARYSTEQYLAEVAADNGDTGATIDRLAARDSEIDPPVLVANLRDPRLHAWVPPGGGPIGALTHAVIHGLDATTPLQLDSPADERALVAVLVALTSSGDRTVFGVDIGGVRLTATDVDWTWGTGRPMIGTASNIVLTLAARALPPGSIEGA